MKKIIILVSSLLILCGCKKEELAPDVVKEYRIYLGAYDRAGLSMDPHMPSLCKGDGVESILRIRGMVHKTTTQYATWDITFFTSPAFVHTAARTDSVQFACSDFDIEVIGAKYDPHANGDAGAYINEGIVGQVEADCTTRINPGATPRAIKIKVTTKFTREDMSDKQTDAPINQKTEELFLDCPK